MKKVWNQTGLRGGGLALPIGPHMTPSRQLEAVLPTALAACKPLPSHVPATPSETVKLGGTAHKFVEVAADPVERQRGGWGASAISIQHMHMHHGS